MKCVCGKVLTQNDKIHIDDNDRIICDECNCKKETEVFNTALGIVARKLPDLPEWLQSMLTHHLAAIHDADNQPWVLVIMHEWGELEFRKFKQWKNVKKYADATTIVVEDWEDDEPKVAAVLYYGKSIEFSMTHGEGLTLDIKQAPATVLLKPNEEGVPVHIRAKITFDFPISCAMLEALAGQPFTTWDETMSVVNERLSTGKITAQELSDCAKEQIRTSWNDQKDALDVGDISVESIHISHEK